MLSLKKHSLISTAPSSTSNDESKTLTYLHRPISPLTTLPIRPVSLISASFAVTPGFASATMYTATSAIVTTTATSATAATVATTAAASATAVAVSATTVEHVTLFKVRPNRDPSAMPSNLLSLSSLNLASHIFVALLFHSHLFDGFTHLLHAHTPPNPHSMPSSPIPPTSKSSSPTSYPSVMIYWKVDWVTDAPFGPPPGFAARLALIKAKAGVAAREVVGVLDGVEGQMPEGVVHVSYGENFSLAKANGYGVGFLCALRGLEEVVVVDRAREVEALKEKVRPLLESVIVVDYMILIILKGSASLRWSPTRKAPLDVLSERHNRE